MGRRNDAFYAVEDELRSAGITPLIRFGRHVRFHWVHKGRKGSTTVPTSSKSPLPAATVRAQVRRKLRSERRD
jgi:hypothetical protein